MKIEKINKNSLKIIMTVEELSEKNITIKDIESGKKKAQNFFFDAIEDSAYADEFLQDDTRLLVEVSVTQDNKFCVTITKIDIYEDFTAYLPNKKLNTNTPSLLYIFGSSSNLVSFLNQVHLQKLYTGINNLYKNNNNYLIDFTKSTIKNDDFLQTFNLLTEYTDLHISKPLLICRLKENSNLLIKKNAINTLCDYLFE